KSLGREHPFTATTLNNLGIIYRKLRRYQEAEPYIRRSLAIQEKTLGRDHPRVAAALQNLASFYHYQPRRQLKKAETLYKRALAIHKKTRGPEHHDVATDLGNLALLYQLQRRYKEAETLFLRSLAIYEKRLGPNHPQIVRTLSNISRFYGAIKKTGKASAFMGRAFQMRAALARRGKRGAATVRKSAEATRKRVARRRKESGPPPRTTSGPGGFACGKSFTSPLFLETRDRDRSRPQGEPRGPRRGVLCRWPVRQGGGVFYLCRQTPENRLDPPPFPGNGPPHGGQKIPGPVRVLGGDRRRPEQGDGPDCGRQARRVLFPG
ncbi:MAG: tetratricopeptide repeat protein, partial [Nitrospinota bacterium]